LSRYPVSEWPDTVLCPMRFLHIPVLSRLRENPKNSRRKCLLIPSAKVGADSFVKVCEADAFDTIITDWDCMEDQIAAIEEKGVEVIVVEEA